MFDRVLVEVCPLDLDSYARDLGSVSVGREIEFVSQFQLQFALPSVESNVPPLLPYSPMSSSSVKPWWSRQYPLWTSQSGYCAISGALRGCSTP
jgi:hypothetical protein